MKMTSTMTRILRLLGSGPWAGLELSGGDVIRQLGCGSGTAYPALMRLEADHLLTSRWAEPSAKGSPRRRVYKVTDAGAAWAINDANKFERYNETH
jgi:PadR family transcriptional regulator, regulatory protein PadR